MENKYMYSITDELDPETFHKFEKMSKDEIGEWLEKQLDKKIDIVDWDLDIALFKVKIVYQERRGNQNGRTKGLSGDAGERDSYGRAYLL